MTIEEGPALSEERSAAGPPSALDPDELCAQVDWLRSVSRSLVRDPWRAEDVAQETLLAALNAPPRSAGDVQHVRAWLGRVAFNLSRLGARRAARQHAREARVARRESLPPVTEELELAGTARLVEEAIATLPGPYQRVVRLRYFEGHSTAAIAAHLGTSELAVRKRLWRARTRLRATLERGGKREPFWVTLLLLRGRELGAPGLTALAAGVAASVGGLAWWLGAGDRSPAVLAEVALAGALEPGGSAAGRAPGASAPAPAELPGDPATRPEPQREPRTRAPERGPRNGLVGPPPVAAHGLVLDLEGRPRAELAIHRAGAPEEILAESDALGRFTLARRGPLELVAAAQGWSTLVPGAVARGAEDELARIVVTPSADLELFLVGPRGEPVPGARVELRCEDLAFARLDFAVRLPTPVLRSGASDAAGALALAELPRGRGLVLRVAAEGFEPLERATLDLGARAWLELVPERLTARLTGTVFHRDGRPAAGARVELAEASVVADAHGRYRLPLRGVGRESGLTAVDPGRESAPLELERFGARLEDWMDTVEVAEQPEAPLEHELDLVLGAHLERVTGELLGRAPEGWRVAAFARAGEAGADGLEAPAATTHSDARGAFELLLAPGAYDLYALAPGGACVVAGTELVTGSTWRLALPEELPLQPAELRLTSDDGCALAHARATLLARLDGPEGRRRLAWRELESDATGRLAFARDPALALELSVAHPRAAGRVDWDGAAPAAVLARPVHLALRAVPPEFESAVVLDAGGLALVAEGPLGPLASLAFSAGETPVVEVSPAARWLELRSATLGPVLVPLEASPGAELVVRP